MSPDLFLGAPTFMLAFARVAGMLGSSPFFGGRMAPMQFRILASLFVTLLVLPLLPPVAHPLPASLLGLALSVAREVAIGIAVGLLTQVVFVAVQMAGELLGMQSGYGALQAADPGSGLSLPIISQMYSLFALLLFFSMDGHHMLIRGIFESFRLVPLGGASLNPAIAPTLADAVGRVFVMSLELCGPVLAALFLCDVALGLIARTIPQMNVFTVGFPVKLALGLVTVAVTLPLLASTLRQQFAALEPAIRLLLRGM